MKMEPINVSKSNLSNLFISLKPGESRVFVFQGDPFPVTKHWLSDQKHSVMCTAPECEWCAKGEKRRTQVRYNVIIKSPESGKPEARVLECSVTLHNQLCKIHEHYPINENYIVVERIGTGLDTTYSVIPSKLKLSPESLAELSLVPLVPLDPKDPMWNAPKKSDFAESEEVPF